ncbi:MAG TPA: hypothetical protein PKX48_00115 [Planctomycetota bacterium]|jgi:hypothetical protein|nr:hypothetical protein [Planctomycetota bacterium]OQC20015.1 MAG: hypothetical protein BWX69_02171 [Planctomycetes bacterium ADurb.Bin069]HNR99571.1 hypothetical protein [Planctomycetota bacterium]HNU26493.1 hypothetical protein [Planctomycetota bacterium]HOE28405.1 hypothetical protein [Planctomycetota bacterium]
MKYASWEQRILRENDLSARIIAFLATARTAARIEGRVAFAMPDLDDMTKRYAGCRAGMALLHQWERQRHHDSARYVAISPPRLIIDDAWLADREQAPIPHVELWMARTADGLPPLGDEPATLAKTTGDATLDALLFDGASIVKRREGKRTGAWLVTRI